MSEQEDDAGHSSRPCAGTLEDAERNAFANQRAQVANPANLEGLDTANVVDGCCIEHVATQRNGGIDGTEEQLQRRAEAESAVQLGAVVFVVSNRRG